MVDKILEEVVKPELVIKTQTNSNILSTEKDIVIDGDEGIETVKKWASQSWEQGRDLEIKGGKLTFRRKK